MPKLINDTIPPPHMELLDLALSHVKVDEAHVSRFERFGFSGAYLYQLTSPGTVSFVVKIDHAHRIDNEATATDNVRFQFSDLHVEEAIGPCEEQKALMYRLVKGPTGKVVELKQKYESALGTMREGSEDPDRLRKRVVRAIAETYRKFETAHVFTQSDAKDKYGEQYGGYVKQRKGFTDRLTQLFESHPARLSAYGMEFDNPRKRIERFLDEPLQPLWVSATHGDLHPSNVVFSSNDDPRLVDFAKAARNQHLFKDFVTMESSLRFMMFPRHIHPALIGPVDAALNKHWSCKTARRIVQTASRSDGAWALQVMIDCVQAVRKACDNALDNGGPQLTADEKQKEYFRCLALLLLGQQQFDTFPLIRVAVNLHLLGELYA